MSTELCPTCGGGKFPGGQVAKTCPDAFHEHAWTRIMWPPCDICGSPALWEHPLGGLRCGHCARTAVTK